MTESVLIVGAGRGLSASLARKCAQAGMHVSLAARAPKKIETIANEIGAEVYACDASEIDQVANLFEMHDQLNRPLTMVVYNPSARVRGPIHELDTQQTKRGLKSLETLIRCDGFSNKYIFNIFVQRQCGFQ